MSTLTLDQCHPSLDACAERVASFRDYAVVRSAMRKHAEKRGAPAHVRREARDHANRCLRDGYALWAAVSEGKAVIDRATAPTLPEAG